MMHTRRTFLRTSVSAGAALFAEALGAREPKHAPARSPAEPPRQTEDVIFLGSTDPGYAAARQVYNAGVLLRPNSIALSATEAGVQKALQRGEGGELAGCSEIRWALVRGLFTE